MLGAASYVQLKAKRTFHRAVYDLALAKLAGGAPCPWLSRITSQIRVPPFGMRADPSTDGLVSERDYKEREKAALPMCFTQLLGSYAMDCSIRYLSCFPRPLDSCVALGSRAHIMVCTSINY